MELLREINEKTHQACEELVAMMEEIEKEQAEDEKKAKECGKPLSEYLKEQFGLGATEPESAPRARAGEMEWRRQMGGEQRPGPLSPEVKKDEPGEGHIMLVKQGPNMAKYVVQKKEGSKVMLKKLRTGLPMRGSEDMPETPDFDLVFRKVKKARDPESGKDAWLVVA